VSGTVGDRSEERVRGVEHDETEAAAVTGSQLPRCGIAHEAELVDRLIDLLRGRLGDLRRTVDHEGDGPHRDSGALGDFAHTHLGHGSPSSSLPGPWTTGSASMSNCARKTRPRRLARRSCLLPFTSLAAGAADHPHLLM